MDDVLDILKEHPDFRWYVDTYITQAEPFLRLRPERYGELKKQISEGKIGIGGTFTNLRPSMVGEETQVRDITIGKNKYRELFPHADLSVYAGNVDVSVGHPQMPQMLSLAGYKYLRFWRPHQALSRKSVPLEFFWKGLDGSKILSSRGCYSGFNYIKNLFVNLRKDIAEEQCLSPSGIRWISQGGDDSRPLRIFTDNKVIPIFDFMKQWNKQEPIPLGFATPLEYFQELEKWKRAIPVLSGSLDPCEVCYNVGWGGSEGLFSLRQENEIHLTEAERWLSIASFFGHSSHEKEMRLLWEKHLLTCAHATQWLFEEDFQEIHRTAVYVQLESDRLKEGALSFLKNIISTKENSEVILFNSLACAREAKVLLVVSFPKGAQRLSLMDGKRRNIPFQVKSINEKVGNTWEYEIMARVKVPPFGYNTISGVRAKPKPVKVGRLPLAVSFEDSYITAVETGSERYAATRDNSFGDLKLYRVDTTKGAMHVGPITGKQAVKWEQTKIMEDGGIYSRYRSLGKVGEHKVRRDTIVYKDEPRIEFQITVDWVGDDGFLTLEWPVLFRGKIYGDFPFGVEEKDIETQVYDGSIERQRKNLFFAKSFLNYTNGKKSVSYLNVDATHYYILLEHAVGNILLNSVTHRPGWERYVNEKNLAEGRHTFTSHLIFHPGNWRTVKLPAVAQSLFRGPAKVWLNNLAFKGSLPPIHSFLSLSPDNLIITGFYRQGGNFILRCYESAGKNTKGRLKLPAGVKEVKKVDLEGNVLSSFKLRNTIPLEVKPREIVTLQFSFI